MDNFSILFPPRRNSPFLQFVPISSKKKKKNDPALRDKSDTSAPPRFQRQKVGRRIELQVSRLHRNTRVIFMDRCHVSWPSGEWKRAPLPSPCFPQTRASSSSSSTRGSTRPREQIMARGPHATYRYIAPRCVISIGGVQVKGSLEHFSFPFFSFFPPFPSPRALRIAECRRVQGLPPSKLIHRDESPRIDSIQLGLTWNI